MAGSDPRNRSVFNPLYWVPVRLTYSWLFWALSIVSFVLCVGDRLWLDGTNGDLLMKRGSRGVYPEGEIGSVITEWFWVITARTLIVSLNISFVTVMWVIPNFIEEAAPSYVDMDVRNSNIFIHKFTGIWLNGVVVVLHCALIILPKIVDGKPFDLVLDGFNFDEWWDPCVRKFSAYITPEQVYLTLDEIFRLALSILCFMILMPISRSNWMLSRSYSTAMVIHAIAGFAFMIDMVRKNSHPLCYRFNLPFIFLYCLDRLYAMFFYRVSRFTVHKIKKCSDNTFIMYGRIPDLPYDGQGCGDNYYLLHRFKRKDSSLPMFQRAHPYTAFQNWDKNTRYLWNIGFLISGNPKNKRSWSMWLANRNVNMLVKPERKAAITNEVNSHGDNKKVKRHHQNLGVQMVNIKIKNEDEKVDGKEEIVDKSVIKPKHDLAFDNKGYQDEEPGTRLAVPKGSKIDSEGQNSASGIFCEADKIKCIEEDDDKAQVEFDLRSYGPYRSSFYGVANIKTYKHLVLIGGGSGFGYVFSVLAIINDLERMASDADVENNSKLFNTTIYFSARDKGLVEECCKLLCKIPNYNKCRYNIHYTGKEDKVWMGKEYTGVDGSPSSSKMGNHVEMFHHFQVKSGRMDIKAALCEYAGADKAKDTLVCVCASEKLLDEVKGQCRKYGLRLRTEEI